MAFVLTGTELDGKAQLISDSVAEKIAGQQEADRSKVAVSTADIRVAVVEAMEVVKAKLEESVGHVLVGIKEAAQWIKENAIHISEISTRY